MSRKSIQRVMCLDATIERSGLNRIREIQPWAQPPGYYCTSVRRIIRKKSLPPLYDLTYPTTYPFSSLIGDIYQCDRSISPNLGRIGRR